MGQDVGDVTPVSFQCLPFTKPSQLIWPFLHVRTSHIFTSPSNLAAYIAKFNGQLSMTGSMALNFCQQASPSLLKRNN